MKVKCKEIVQRMEIEKQGQEVTGRKDHRGAREEKKGKEGKKRQSQTVKEKNLC